MRLRHNNINRDSGTKLPDAWMPTVRKRDRRKVHQGLPREQLLCLAGTVRIEMHQSQPTIVIQKLKGTA